ncbi:P-loop NTPase family protein [Xanthobacter agilis]|uniref:hypothetical protein n=1 Tax=Xanthobacter agilis TaxID=47492 RepID=UPI00372B9AA0
MLPADVLTRTLIIGNSGAGKSGLAQHLAARLRCPAFDLDHIHWEPGGYGRARDKAATLALVRDAAAGACWIIEGVSGRLARIAAPRATAMIWSAIPVAECLDNLRRRGVRRGAGMDDLNGLMRWAGA